MSRLNLEPSSVVNELLRRNGEFAEGCDLTGLTLLPRRRTIILGCVDPRVDPAVVLGVPLGGAVVIRNVGGRITPTTMRTLALLAAIARSGGTQPGAGWNLVVVHHTDCGITRLLDYPEALAAELGTSPEELDPESITDPRASLTVDLAALHANPLLPAGLIVSGLLYHTDTPGRIETVVHPSTLGQR